MEDNIANICVAIDINIKSRTKMILNDFGLSEEDAINILYRQIILQEEFPLNVKYRNIKHDEIENILKSRLNEKLEKGYDDIVKGRYLSAEETFAIIKDKYNL